jgi:hypothetical protein
VDDGDPNRFSFAFVDGTGLQAADGWHQDSFWVEVQGDTLYLRDEVYAPNDLASKEEEGDSPPVTYRRVAAAPAG